MTDKELEKLAEDHKKIREGILDVTINWAGLENGMALLLDAVIGGPGRGHRGIGLVIYHAPASADTRFTIVDHALDMFLSPDSDLSKQWANLYKRIKNKKIARNKIIHGNAVTLGKGDPTKNFARLTPPLFDLKQHRKQFLTGQLPGMSGHDVQKVASGISTLTKEVHDFTKLVEAL